LEAMKMENSFLSPRDGIIKSISVRELQTKRSFNKKVRENRIKNQEYREKTFYLYAILYENNEKNISCQ
jgi:nitrogen fixation/metabolism regulation signal transduction histidine kinase